MAERITKAHLDDSVKRINILTKSPAEPGGYYEGGKPKANPNNYHLSWAYGGVKLARTCSDGHGEDDISAGGFGTKRELYHWMNGFIKGLEA